MHVICNLYYYCACLRGGSVEIEFMVQIQFELPNLLNFKAPEDFPHWKQRFE